MDSSRSRQPTREMPPLLVSPLRTELYSPLKTEHNTNDPNHNHTHLDITSITVHDEDDGMVETISVKDHHHDHHLRTTRQEQQERDEFERLDVDSETDDGDGSDSASQFSELSSTAASFGEQQPAALIQLTPAHLAHLNAQFENMEPQAILRTCSILFPNLYQTTAFGLTGLVTLDMLHKIAAQQQQQGQQQQQQQPELIFLDTLHHFQETHDLVSRVRERYPSVKIHTFRPKDCASADEFARRHGSDRLWETDPERYDFLAKVEPQQRAERELHVAAVITGRRRSQGGDRAAMPVVEMVAGNDDDHGSATGMTTMMVKINPLARWSFGQVKAYIDDNSVPYNALLDRGYRSVGDWHSTVPVREGEGEREGRWKGQEKTECGIHNKKSRYAMFLAEMARKQQQQQEEEKEEQEVKKKVQEDDDIRGVDDMVFEWTAAALPAPQVAVSARETTVEGRRVGFGPWGAVISA